MTNAPKSGWIHVLGVDNATVLEALKDEPLDETGAIVMRARADGVGWDIGIYAFVDLEGDIVEQRSRPGEVAVYMFDGKSLTWSHALTFSRQP